MSARRGSNDWRRPPFQALQSETPQPPDGSEDNFKGPEQLNESSYPRLDEMPAINEMSLSDTYTINDVANCVGITVMAIRDRVASGQLAARYLRRRAKFFPRRIPPS